MANIGLRTNPAGDGGAITLGGTDVVKVDASSITIPVITTTQKTALGNAAARIVFDSTLGKLCINDGAGWQTVTSV